jgi:cobalt/nickel transport protein
VALANPYTDDLAGALPVQLWLDGEPRRTSQVEVYSRPIDGGEADMTLYQTDGNGIVVIAVTPGTEYLVNAVTLEPIEYIEGGDGAEWRTLWASLTFEVPSPATQ